jgi:hypothetical protein
MKYLFMAIMFVLSGCNSQASQTRMVEVKPEPHKFAFQKCFPAQEFHPPKNVLSYATKDGATYWQVETFVKDKDQKFNSYFQILYFKTNGGCQQIGNPTSSRLKFMPRDAAIALSQQHFNPYFKKCLKKNSKQVCINQLTKSINGDKEQGDEQTLIFPEDVIVLREFGVKVNATKGH